MKARAIWLAGLLVVSKLGAQTAPAADARPAGVTEAEWSVANHVVNTEIALRRLLADASNKLARAERGKVVRSMSKPATKIDPRTGEYTYHGTGKEALAEKAQTISACKDLIRGTRAEIAEIEGGAIFATPVLLSTVSPGDVVSVGADDPESVTTKGASVQIMQIVSATEMIVDYGNNRLFWVEGEQTTGYVDDAAFVLRGPYQVSTTKYPTVDGAARTIQKLTLVNVARVRDTAERIRKATKPATP